jgi:ubiquinone/menaquinone biosynthesis C-methylase UbiE
MSSDEILRFFETVRIKELISFRALCNALKAYLVREAVNAWRAETSGRLSVLDLGCGRGGDLRKWASYRLRSFFGVDGGTTCVEEARARHAGLVSQGKSTVQATFHTADLTSEHLPTDSRVFDIVSSMFFLQFCFSTSKTASHILDEIARVLKDNGVLCCILPDGNRVTSLLRDRRSQIAFGHFKLHKCHPTEEDPYGMAYNFSLTEAACTEYIVSPKLLQGMLEKRGFSGAWPGGEFFMGAQQLLSQGAESEIVSTILRGQKCSQIDWMSLGFFTVVLAKKKSPKDDATEKEVPMKKRRKASATESSRDFTAPV